MCILVVEMGDVERGREANGRRRISVTCLVWLVCFPPESQFLMCMCLTYCTVTLGCTIDVMGSLG